MSIIYTGGSSSQSLITALGGTPSTGYNIVIEGDTHYNADLNISTNQGNSARIKDPAQVGGAGTSMLVDLSGGTDVLYMESSRPCYVGGAGTGGTITKVIVDPKATRGLSLTAGTVANLEMEGGLVYAEAGCDLQNAKLAGGTIDIADHLSHTLDTLSLYGQSTAELRRTCGTSVHVDRNAWLITNNRSATLATVTVAGKYTVNNGDIGTKLTLLPGAEIDFSTMVASITSAATEVWPGVKVIGDVPAGLEFDPGTLTFIAGGSPGPWGTP